MIKLKDLKKRKSFQSTILWEHLTWSQVFHDVSMFALLRIGRVMRPGGGESYLFYLIVTARQNNLNSHMKIVFLMNYY